MIHSLDFHDVGPAPHFGPISFGDRLNVLAGDNGLGKTFVLDSAWWALTGSWPDPARPALPPTAAQRPAIASSIAAKTRPSDWESVYDFRTQQWPLPPGRPSNPGLVLYFRVDGQFSLWDPTLHYWKRNRALNINSPERPDALSLASGDVWNAIPGADGKIICRGIIDDWVSWQTANGAEFEQLRHVVKALSPQRVDDATPRRLWLDDQRDHPVLRLPYGEVPLVLASAGLRRALSVAYLLVWAWQAHQRNAELIKQPAETRITVLFDEPETHLHPQWQRRVVPGLLDAIRAMDSRLSVQLLVGTHSPLVLASLESFFDDSRDALFHLSLEDAGAKVERVPWAPRGDAAAWLTSPLFGLEQARSVEAEEAIEAAELLMRGGVGDRQLIHERLVKALPGTDRFWPRWLVKTGQV